MKVAIYVRVSTKKQAQNEVSLADQLSKLTSWVLDEKHEIVEIFEDKGRSAFQGSRPLYDEMISLALSDEHPFDAIAFYDFSRFSRKTKILLHDYERLQMNDVKIISLSENLPNNEMTPMFLAMLGSMNESSSIRTSVNVTRCQRANAENGYFNGSRAPYGYRSIKVDNESGGKRRSILVLDPDESEIVRLIFDLAMHGTHGQPFTLNEIVSALDRRGLTKRSKQWSNQMLSKLLLDTTYYGERATFKIDGVKKKERPSSEWVITEVPAIVTEEEFRRTREIVGDRRIEKMPGKRAIHSSQLLSGLAFCGNCGQHLICRWGTSKVKKRRYAY